MTPSAAPPGSTVDENPLPPCPGTPNCVRRSRHYATSPDTLYWAAQDALDSLCPATLRLFPDEWRAEAEYRVVPTLCTDDVDVVVQAGNDGGSTLHIRSASRAGWYDLGVNRRRIERFFVALEQALDDN